MLGVQRMVGHRSVRGAAHGGPQGCSTWWTTGVLGVQHMVGHRSVRGAAHGGPQEC